MKKIILGVLVLVILLLGAGMVSAECCCFCQGANVYKLAADCEYATCNAVCSSSIVVAKTYEACSAVTVTDCGTECTGSGTSSNCCTKDEYDDCSFAFWKSGTGECKGDPSCTCQEDTWGSPVPEFSTVGILIAALVIAGVVFLIIKKKKEKQKK
ncbi:hypothetical protein GOV06_01075 [Candidatus Woesearchaeota archaeon]|nr:hypothetical protein [Candidatus Woesearchaeota archaeon]